VPAALEPYLNQEEPSDEQPEAGEPGRARRLASRFGSIFSRSNDAQGDENEANDEEQPIIDSQNPDSPDRENQGMEDTQEPEGAPKKPGLFRRFLKRVSQLSQPDMLEEELSQEDESDPPIELVFAYYPDPSPLFDEQGRPQFPVPLSPLCELSFTEQVRPESVSVIKSFHDDGIGVKIFAAERPNQIIDLLKKAGLSEKSLNTISGADLAQLDEEELILAAEDNGIFLNLAPEQMGEIVAALRAKGQYVAMVGDAVNDVPALRQANLSAAYQGSSPAAQSVADILLLENTLRVLNRVLDKGQRIVNGLLDILKLYLTQVSYLTLMIIGILIIGVGFPVRGIQLTIITTVTITIPSLGLTLWANPGVLHGDSLRKSLSHFIVPAAITVSIAGIVTYFTFREVVLENEYTHLAVTYTLVFTGLLVVLFLRPPFRLLAGGAPFSKDRRIFLMVVVLTVLFFITVALSSAIPFLYDLLLLEWLNPFTDYLIIATIVIVWAVLLLLIWRIWRTSGIWEDQEVSKVEEIENEISATADQSDENQFDGNPPQQTT